MFSSSLSFVARWYLGLFERAWFLWLLRKHKQTDQVNISRGILKRKLIKKKQKENKIELRQENFY